MQGVWLGLIWHRTPIEADYKPLEQVGWRGGNSEHRKRNQPPVKLGVTLGNTCGAPAAKLWFSPGLGVCDQHYRQS